MNLRVVRGVLGLFVAVAVLSVGVWVWKQQNEVSRSSSIDIGGPFEMTTHLGTPVTENDYLGRPIAMFFGFTNCPDICPTTLLRMSDLMSKLGPSAERLQVVLVSVDPERDTPDVLKAYLEQFDRRFTALTGTSEQLATFARRYRFYYKKVLQSDGGYTMDHSAGVFLFNAKAQFVGTLDAHETDDIVLKKLQRLLAL